LGPTENTDRRNAMTEEQRERQPEFTTDEIIAVYEHLARNDRSWSACIADHGLDPMLVNRAFRVFFDSGDGRLRTAVEAFVLGLQFGAMRLDPVDYDESAEPVCNCFFCMLRRSAEAELGGGGGRGVVRRLALLVGLFLAVAAPASASTTIIAPAGSAVPYTEWVAEAKVPTPPVTLTVVEARCFDDEAAACTSSGTFTIWDADEGEPRATFWHELGHNFDYYALPAWARERFEILTEDARPWTADPNGPNENFASAYARCAETGPRFRGDPNLRIKGNGAAIDRVTYRRICRMIVTAATDA
jgi:hypothetical protein